MTGTKIKALNANMDSSLGEMLPDMEEIYKDFHRNPELSMQEKRTIMKWPSFLG